MVHIVRPVWEEVGADNQLERKFPPLTYTQEDATGWCCSSRRRAPSGRPRLAECRPAVRQRLRAGFPSRGAQAGDFFGNDDVLYLMEDMATGEIRVSILWEWLHKARN